MPDSQDVKILNQIFPHLMSHQTGGVNINVIQRVEIRNEAQNFDFFDFLSGLPEGDRLEALKTMAIKTVCQHFKTKALAAEFLGVSYRTITGRLANEDEDMKVLPMRRIAGGQGE